MIEIANPAGSGRGLYVQRDRTETPEQALEIAKTTEMEQWDGQVSNINIDKESA